jgi:CRP-like cAMP-binding protein
MILCSYTLDLTCDSSRHHPFEEATTAQYTARLRADSVAQARTDGWKLRKGKATCPRCASVSTLQPRPTAAERVDAAVLVMLRASHGPVIAKDLARLCNVGPPTMTRALQRLEQEGKIRKIRKTRTSHWLEAV